MDFPFYKEPVKTQIEGVYLRPEYKAPVGMDDEPLALDILEKGFCDAEGKALSIPEELGAAQAIQVIFAYRRSLVEVGKLGVASMAKSLST